MNKSYQKGQENSRKTEFVDIESPMSNKRRFSVWMVEFASSGFATNGATPSGLFYINKHIQISNIFKLKYRLHG